MAESLRNTEDNETEDNIVVDDAANIAAGEADPLAYALRHLHSHWPDVDRSTVWTAGQLLRAADLVRNDLDAVVRDTGVTFSRLELLLMLFYSRKGELTLSRISERIMIQRSSVTGTVDRLVDLGLVERIPNETDRRSILARLTPKGRRAVKASVPPLVEAGFGLGGLSPEERLQLGELLSKVRRTNGDCVGTPDLSEDEAPLVRKMARGPRPR